MPESRSPPNGAGRPRSSGRPDSSRPPSQDSIDFPIVGIGASAGGLDACRKLVSGLPTGSGMAFILIQHLDPTHESMMVDLLTGHTSMVVTQASDGMTIEPEHLYVIPPGPYLSVGDGVLHLSQPQARHGARLPFDFLLRSLAADLGARAMCVVLSGSGADGSLGVRAVKDAGGLVVVQDPEEAGYDGMPRHAIATGAVDMVLPASKIGEALVSYELRAASTRDKSALPPKDVVEAWLPEVIDLLHTRTARDFRLYKPGTLQRRIERRMAMAIETDDMDRYLERLRADAGELDLLGKDLLINVTNFFRDPKVFELLSETIIPDLVHSRSPDQPLRIWIAGCSTGEETYSLTMLFREQIVAAKLNVKLQVFASDVDPDAVAVAREGFYPDSIESDVSPERLARFFSKEDRGYRVSPDLRSAVVFTVQDVLADPPFSRLDLVSCRNLLIYLRPEAQAKVISVFHFALREGGVLLLGSSETVGGADDRFEVISKQERLYRHVGRARSGEPRFSMGMVATPSAPARPGQDLTRSRQAALAELCRRLILDAYAPAAVLINRKSECLYFLGPTDRYLKVAPGHPVNDLLAMAREGVRTKLRSAIHRATEENARIVVQGGRLKQGENTLAFSITVQPVLSEGERLMLICFADERKDSPKRGRAGIPDDAPKTAELERELDATRAELQGAIRNLEISSEEQKAINEEALSVNEEFQSTNEELLTSKEELQSLNEELTALNTQLQETLERQRTTSNDLQNVLYSTDVATIFLDTDLNIRFFTPATKLLFSVIPGDVGRPLADLSSLAADGELLSDARKVLKSHAPIEREIEAKTGAWYVRRVLPYRTQDNGVAGVVITFVDSSARRLSSQALGAAEKKAQHANLAKSRFLAAASHDLRQPLQTLALLQGMLARTAQGEKAQRLIARLDETLGGMTGMLNVLLDINEIEAGAIAAAVVDFPVNELLDRMNNEFLYHAQAKRLELRTIRSGLRVRSDPRLLEQMLRNLLSNALKYTKQGKVLFGCRRRGGILSIEVWDTGIGIPEDELQQIFDEYHQVGNAARERNLGLGLGLSIVQRLGDLLGHRVRVRSHLGTGTGFSVEVPISPNALTPGDRRRDAIDAQPSENASRTGVILIVEDDPEVSDLLEQYLKDEGHRTAVAVDGVQALELVARGTIRPDLIIADYNLPNGPDGLEMIVRIRENLGRELPVVFLTGDISTATARKITLQKCTLLNKPVKLKHLMEAVQRLLPAPQPETRPRAAVPAAEDGGKTPPIVFVVDDDNQVREAIRSVLEDDGHTVEDYASCEAFLAAYRPGGEACLLVDAILPGMSGTELLQRLGQAGHSLPAVMITGNSDVPMAVEAMKAGASDLIEKPVSRGDLLACVARAFDLARDSSKLAAWQADAAGQIAGLTDRQREIMEMVLAGHPSKNIAADLGISQRTVENHRAAIMTKTGSKSLPALARLALAAAPKGTGEPATREPDPAARKSRR